MAIVLLHNAARRELADDLPDWRVLSTTGGP